MSQETNGFSFGCSTSNQDQSKNNIYLQIATPKSPNSDGFSPTEIHDEHSLEEEIKENVMNQVDIEILLKHREYNLIQNEISKVQTQLDTLQKLHDDPNYSKYVQNLIELKDNAKNELNFPNMNDSEIITRRHSVYNIRKSTSDEPPKPQRTSYGGLRPVVDSQGNKICVHKRSDGVIVKIECPTCARSDFGSAQGFLNHSRLAHQVEYKSQDHAALVCGTILPDIEQDDVGIASIQKLKDMGIDPDKNLAPGVIGSGGSFGTGDDMNGPQKKKARRSISKPGVPSGYLEKLYNNKEEFKDIYQDATTKTEVDFADEEEPEVTTPPISQDSSTLDGAQQKLFKKGHNRRKSRGGLSAVTFEDQVVTQPTSSDHSEGERLSPREITSHELIVEENLNSSSSTVRFSENSITFGTENGLTPAQRRRVPTIPNPLRTRSRSSRENSN